MLLIKNTVGIILSKVIYNNVVKSLSKERIESFKTKNRKIYKLISIKHRFNKINFEVPIINLSNYRLNYEERNQLKLGLDFSFVDRNKNTKKFLAASMESVAYMASSKVQSTELEEFHEFLRGYTDIFSKNIFATIHYTYHHLKNLINDDNTVVVRGDKDSSVVIMNKDDYTLKLENMIEEGIDKGTYILSDDQTFKELKRFQEFLYRNFREFEHYDKMRPDHNQPARLYGTAKTHKFSNIQDINLQDLKFRPIIDQTGTYTYHASKVIAEYLKPLCQSDYRISDTQHFAYLAQNLPPLEEDEEDVSYDVDSLFTNIPIQDTIDYIVKEIYVKNKLKPICSKIIFTRLLKKLAMESTFIFNKKFYKQVNGCSMGGPLSVTFSDIFMNKMEQDIVAPLDPIFYRRYVDDIFVRRKLHCNDILFQRLNDYHPNIKLSIETNPTKFLDTKLILNSVRAYDTLVYRKSSKLPTPWTSKVPKRYKRNNILGDLHRSRRISSNFQQEVEVIREKYKKAGFPIRFIDSVIRQFESRIETDTTNQEEESFIIPPYLFEENTSKPFILLELPFCESNELKSKTFLKKFHKFTNSNFSIAVKWKTKQVRSFFPLKDKNPHPSCKIYEGECLCGMNYIGQTKRNVEIRWAEHNNPKHNSEPAKHLTKYIDHMFNWKILCNASSNVGLRKNLEASYIALLRPRLNEQKDFERLILFRNGIT